MSSSPFHFGDVVFSVDSDDLVAELPEDIADVDQLLEAYANLLEFPGYFGFNWNAMDECLRDLEWIENRRVVVVHKALPRIGRLQLKIYLDVLGDWVREWEEDGLREVVVAFPRDLEELVDSLYETRSDLSADENEDRI